MPGEAPQPLTLNHPASNPGRISGRGLSFQGSRFRTRAACAANLIPAHDSIVALDRGDGAGIEEDRASGLERARDPLLACGHRVACGEEPSGPRSLSDGVE